MVAWLGSSGDSIYIVLMNDPSRDQTQLSGGSMRHVLGSAGRGMDESRWVVGKGGFLDTKAIPFFFPLSSGQPVGRSPGCILYCDILRFMFVVITPSLPVADTFYCIVTFIVGKVLIDASSYIMLNVITYASLYPTSRAIADDIARNLLMGAATKRATYPSCKFLFLKTWLFLAETIILKRAM